MEASMNDEDAMFLTVAEHTIGDAIETVEHVIESLTWLGTEPNPIADDLGALIVDRAVLRGILAGVRT
jgi:hypothetical protein